MFRADARVLLQTPSALQLNASQPLAIATEEDPPAAILPASGLMQLGWPSVSWIHPLGQSMHAVEALRRAYLPGLQGKQSTEPVSSAYDPGGQGSWSESSPSHLYPASHCTVALDILT